MLGAEPDVAPPERVRPEAEWREDRLWQPAALAAFVLLVAAVVWAALVGQPRQRRGGVAARAGVAATALLVNQALAEAELAVRVADQLAQTLPAGTSARDFVHTGVGFVLCLLFLLLVTALNLVGWWRSRARPALVGPGDDIHTLRE
jgi:hypothetical protein